MVIVGESSVGTPYPVPNILALKGGEGVRERREEGGGERRGKGEGKERGWEGREGRGREGGREGGRGERGREGGRGEGGREGKGSPRGRRREGGREGGRGKEGREGEGRERGGKEGREGGRNGEEMNTRASLTVFSLSPCGCIICFSLCERFSLLSRHTTSLGNRGCALGFHLAF